MRELLPLALTAIAPALHAQALELYAAERWGGDRVVLDAAAADLSARGFDGRTGSVVVRAGRWELCTDRGHTGVCVVFGPGRYDVLPSTLAQRISSARPVTVTAAAAPDAGMPAAPLPFTGGSDAPLVLYQDAGWQGRAVPISGAVPSLGSLGFNDEASSLEIRAGRWQLCLNADYGPPCRVLGPGRWALEGSFHDGLSSVRPVYGMDDRPLPATGGIVLYRDAGWQGQALMRTEATPNLGPYGFNDETSSIEVLAGRWELCTNSDYGGTCRTYGPGRHALTGGMHDEVSSLRPR